MKKTRQLRIQTVFFITIAILLGGVSMADEFHTAIDATIEKSVKHPDLPGYELIVIQLENLSTIDGALLNVGSKDKTGHEIFEPIWIKWYQNGKVIAKNATALQQSTSLKPKEKIKMCVLVKCPKDGNYTLKITCPPLYGTGNFSRPEGFIASSPVKIKNGNIIISKGQGKKPAERKDGEKG